MTITKVMAELVEGKREQRTPRRKWKLIKDDQLIKLITPR